MAGETPGEKGAPAPAPGGSGAPPGREYYYKIVAVMLLSALTCLLLAAAPWATETTAESREQTTEQLAGLMFGPYGSSVVLLALAMGVAMVGGIFLAREDPADDEREGESGKREGGAVPSRFPLPASRSSAESGEKDGPGGGRA